MSSYPFFSDWVSFPMALAIWNSGSSAAKVINWGGIDPWLWGIWILLYFVLLVHKCWLHQWCRDFWCFWRRAGAALNYFVKYLVCGWVERLRMLHFYPMVLIAIINEPPCSLMSPFKWASLGIQLCPLAHGGVLSRPSYSVGVNHQPK